MSENNVITGVSVVMPNWNGLFLLKQSLDPLIKSTQTYEGETEIIIIDNGSQDRTVDVIADYYPDIVLKKFDKNTGFGHACNAGVAIAKYSHVLLLNNDIYLSEDFLTKLTRIFDKYPDCFSASPQTNYWRGKELTNDVFSSSINISFNEKGDLLQHWGVNNFKNISNDECATFYGTGAALLVDKSKFNELGGFDPIYGLAYWEDIDLCLRAWRKNWGSYYTNSTLAWHKISASSDNDSNELKENLMFANYIVFHLSNVTGIKITLKFLTNLIRYTLPLRKQADKESYKIIVSIILKRLPAIMARRIKLLTNSESSIYKVISDVPFQKEGWVSEPQMKYK